MTFDLDLYLQGHSALTLKIVSSVASTVLDGFFPYVVQMITSMRRCVACDDLWPWPISSRSFGLDLENRVLSVASTVLDGFFPYLVQMISSMRRCVACDDLWPWPISSRSFDLDFENRVRSVTFSVLDRLFFWLGIQYDSIMWVIMRRRGVSSERRRSSYSSLSQMCLWSCLVPQEATSQYMYVNSLWPSCTTWRHKPWWTLVRVMACCKPPLPEAILCIVSETLRLFYR